jgi:RHS repeat-associated protein
LDEGTKHYELTYGVDEERIKSVQTLNNTSITRYYLGDYEEEINSLGGIRKIHYLSGGAMMVNNSGVETLYYGYSDYQGSLLALTNESGTVLEKYAYDPWGVRRNPDDWSQKDLRTSWITNRGYTGHEHLDAFGIINMNGRVYDPLTAMFFSPDPYVQAPDDWLNYNRYSYVLNNPLKYTDPSGNVFYVGVGLGWSYYGGLSISVSGGYGFKGGLSVGITLGYGFGNNNFFATVNASAAGFYGYAGYDTKGGFIAGGGFAPLGTLYSGNAGFSFTSNVVDIGFSYSEHGGWSANICGAQYTRNGVIFDPSLGAGYTVNFNLGRQQQRVTSTYTEIKAFLDETICLPEIPDVALAKVETKLAEMPGEDVLTSPVGNAKVGDTFKMLRTFGSSPHLGTDYKVPMGTEVHPTAKGVVVRAEKSNSYGNVVVIRHLNNIYTLYAHGSKLLVSVNDNVTTKNIIMLSGNTGHSSGPHLHYEVIVSPYGINSPGFYGNVNIRRSPNSLYNLIYR